MGACASLCVLVYTCVCVCVYVYISIYVYVYTHTHTHTHTHICIYIYICFCPTGVPSHLPKRSFGCPLRAAPCHQAHCLLLHNIHACIRVHIHTRSHTNAGRHTHARTHARTYTYTHILIQWHTHLQLLLYNRLDEFFPPTLLFCFQLNLVPRTPLSVICPPGIGTVYF